MIAWRFLSLSVHEITNIDNQYYISILAYVMQAWRRAQILLTFQHIVERCTTDDLTIVITQSLMQQGGLTNEEVGERFICFSGNWSFFS